MIINHKEYITEIVGGVNFTPASFNINPGLSSTFPWLSSVARNFEKYKFRHCNFRYEPEAATTAPGSVMMSVDIDAADAPPVTKAMIMTVKDAQRAPTWSNCETTIPERVAELFVRTTGNPAGTDIKTYDAGKLTVATQGQSASGAVGELYVDYCVELHVPQFPPSDIATTTMISNVTTSNTNIFGINLVNMTVTGDLDIVGNTSNSLAFDVPAEIGNCYLFTFDVSSYTSGSISALALNTGLLGGSQIQLLGTASATYSTLDASYFVAFKVLSLTPQRRASVLLGVTGSYNASSGAVSCSVSPWQAGLAFD